MKTLAILAISLFSQLSFASEEIANVIKGLSPHLEDKKASEYAIIIEKYSKGVVIGQDKKGNDIVVKVDWKVVVAICKQESDFVHGEITEDFRDFGICQLNWRTIKHRKVDLGLLLTDVDYAFHETFVLLGELKYKYNTNSRGHYQWFTRYHSYTMKTRRKYWYGRKRSGHDGLRYKFRMIERLLRGEKARPIAKERKRFKRSVQRLIHTR